MQCMMQTWATTSSPDTQPGCGLVLFSDLKSSIVVDIMVFALREGEVQDYFERDDDNWTIAWLIGVLDVANARRALEAAGEPRLIQTDPGVDHVSRQRWIQD